MSVKDQQLILTDVEVSKEGYTTKTETITVDSEHTSFTITLVAA